MLLTSPEEYAERESDPLHPHPGKVAIELCLHQRCLALLKLKRVKQPDRKVQEGEESNHLSTMQNGVSCTDCLEL